MSSEAERIKALIQSGADAEEIKKSAVKAFAKKSLEGVEFRLLTRLLAERERPADAMEPVVP